MDGIHDMGGMDGFGKVEPEPNEPPFHAPWEGRVLAMQRAMGYAGAWHIDMSRFAQERLPPQVYLTASYYQRWALAMEKNVSSAATPTPDELAAGHALRPGKPLKRKLTPDVVRRGMTRGSFYRQAQAPAAVQAGRPRAHQEHPPADAHAAAALRARQARRGRARATAATCFRIRSRPTRATIRSGSTRWCSTAASCGARMPTRR